MSFPTTRVLICHTILIFFLTSPHFFNRAITKYIFLLKKYSIPVGIVKISVPDTFRRNTFKIVTITLPLFLLGTLNHYTFLINLLLPKTVQLTNLVYFPSLNLSIINLPCSMHNSPSLYLQTYYLLVFITL